MDHGGNLTGSGKLGAGCTHPVIKEDRTRRLAWATEWDLSKRGGRGEIYTRLNKTKL